MTTSAKARPNPISVTAVLMCGLLLAVGASGAVAREVTALIVDPIDIDGDLSDWPEGLVRHRVTHDPGASFMVGYSPDENLLYVGAEVQDDVLVVGNHWQKTDACEVYVYGGPSSKVSRFTSDYSNPLQYALVPGPGEYIPGHGNPTLHSANGGSRNAACTRTEAAYRREGDRTYYEWAVEVYEKFPNRPAKLTPGKTVGFDVVIVDNDNRGSFRWQPWGSTAGMKFGSPDRVGWCVLSEEHAAPEHHGWREFVMSTTRQAWNLLFLGALAVGLVATGYALRRVLGGGSPDVDERMLAFERRLTDTQDVLIALSEKLDRLEERPAHQRDTGNDEKEDG